MKYCPKCFKKYPLSAEKCAGDGSYLVAPMDKDLVGEVLDDRYTVLERIGKGGMGVVYKAEQHLIKRIVAIKVLRRDIVQDESAVKRFLNEARAIAGLDSRHTISLYDFGVTRDGLLYYTMDLLKGRPLSRIIQDEAPLDHVRAAGFLLQACRSLEEAHEHNILHRDLKPENFFVSMKKGKEQLKVLDFGIAKLVGDASMDTVTQAGMIVGTPHYLSPEQAKGKPIAQTSDLYSLGIVLYEMLAGEPPFTGDTPMATLWAHIQDPVPPLHQKNPNVQVPRSIEAFLARALEKEPSDRFQSAASFADALRRAVEYHEASPETVTLPPLSTTDHGLRFRTPMWEADETSAPADEPDVAEVEINDVEVDDIDVEGGTALLRARAVEPPPPEAKPQREFVEEASTSSYAESGATETPAELGSAETAWATEVPVGATSIPASNTTPKVPVLEPEGPEPEPEKPELVPSEVMMSPPMDDGNGVAEGAGERTLALVFPKRHHAKWGAAGFTLVVLVVAVAFWSPWDSAKTAPEENPVIAVASEDPVHTRSGQYDTETSAPAIDVRTTDIDEDTSVVPDVYMDTPAASVSPDDVGTAADVRADESEFNPTVDAFPPPADVVEEQDTHPGDLLPGPESDPTSTTLDVHADAVEPGTPAVSAVDVGARMQAEEAKRLAAAKVKEREAEERKEAKRRAEVKAKKKADAEARRKAKETSRQDDEKNALSKAAQLISKARQEMQKKRFSVALERLNDAATTGGETPEVRTLRSQCDAGIKAQEMNKHLVQAKAAMGRKDFDACIRAAGMASKLASGNGTASSLLKECQEKKAIGETHF